MKSYIMPLWIRYLLGLVLSEFAFIVRANDTDTLSLLFLGDLMQHQEQIDAAKRDVGYCYDDCFAHLQKEFKTHDLVVGNLEVTIGGKPYTGYPAFSAPDEFLYAIRRAGVNVLMTANNHCLDRGRRGLERTIFKLDSLRIPYAGTYRDSVERLNNYPLLVEKKGFRIVFLNYTYGTNGIKVSKPCLVNYIDRDVIRKDVIKARFMKPDVIIACIHWGVEYESLPRRQEMDLADWMISIGVNHIIGSHPHVVQPLILKDSEKNRADSNLVVYSLGNFISNMSMPRTDGGMVVRMVLKKNVGHTRLSSCAYSLIWTSRPRLSGMKQFVVYPSAMHEELLSHAERSRMKAFLEHSRQLHREHSKGVEEYFFQK